MSADENVLFCGVTVGSRLSRLMEELSPSSRRYVSGEPFLSVREAGGKTVIGRPVQAGLPVTELEDFGRNVRSILRKLFPEERLPETDVRLFIVPAEAAAVEADEPALEADEPEPNAEG